MPGQVGGPGASSIDLEVNGAEDRLISVLVAKNFIDHRDSEIPTTGNGIIVNTGFVGPDRAGNIIVDSNTIIGGHKEPPVTNTLSNGIYIFGAYANGVTITNNNITRTGQSGIRLEGSDITCEDNRLDSVGGGGTLGFVALVINSRIRRNTFTCELGPCDGRMIITGEGNTIEDNSGWQLMKGKGRKRSY